MPCIAQVLTNQVDVAALPASDEVAPESKGAAAVAG